MSGRPTRQELYDRIRRSSMRTVIWEEMVRLGFWPRDGEGRPGSLAAEFDVQRDLERQLSALRTEQSRLRDEEKVLAAVRKQRMKASREKRKETLARREAERIAKAQAWQQKKQTEIIWVGAGYSTTLSSWESDTEKLQKNGQPHFPNAGSLASAMGITIAQLRFLCYHRKVSAVSHWVRFDVPKKTGGVRRISAPMPRLKTAQEWVLRSLLDKVKLHEAAHGFVPGRSIVTNAVPHVGRKVVVNLDLADFFPSVNWARVYGVFRSLGHSSAVSTLLAMLCTEAPTEEVELDGRRWFVATGERRLPQGAPTSPAITNILCRGFDARLSGTATALGFTYTRYADDLSFSSEGCESEAVGKLLRRVRWTIRQEGFEVHPDKTRVHRRGRRQEVTGLTVNDKLGVERKTLRRFKAALHTAETKGVDAASWGADGVDTLNSLEGYANFVFMVDPTKGAQFQQRVAALRGANPERPRHPVVSDVSREVPPVQNDRSVPPPLPTPAPTPATEPEEPKDDEAKPDEWWKLW